jgi:hypothetical protein
LKGQNVEEKRIKAISNIILATVMGYKPKNILEEIIIDADCAHLASKNFFDYTSLLRKEWELTGLKTVTYQDWIKENINFFYSSTPF